MKKNVVTNLGLFSLRKNDLPDRVSNPGLPRDRREYLPLYYRGMLVDFFRGDYVPYLGPNFGGVFVAFLVDHQNSQLPVLFLPSKDAHRLVTVSMHSISYHVCIRSASGPVLSPSGRTEAFLRPHRPRPWPRLQPFFPSSCPSPVDRPSSPTHFVHLRSLHPYAPYQGSRIT